MKLYIEDGETLPAIQYLDDEDDSPSGFTESTDPIDWHNHENEVDVDYCSFRNEMIDKFEPNWGSYSDDKKEKLIQDYIYPSETTTEELDGLYSESERDNFQDVMVEKLTNNVTHIIRSSESRKDFILLIDDSGVRTYKEIKTDEKI